MNKLEVAKGEAERRVGLRDPLDLFGALEEEVWGMWDRLLPSTPWPLLHPLRRFGDLPARWIPSTDVYQREGRLVVQVDLPGMAREDIRVTLEEGALVIRGERKTETEVAEESYHRRERRYGGFLRRVPLSFEVKPEEVQASFKDGVLEVSLPLPQEVRPAARQIEVR